MKGGRARQGDVNGRLAKQVFLGVPHELADAGLPQPGRVDAAHDRDREPARLAHDQLGGRRQLVRGGHLGHLHGAAEGVGRAPQIDHCGDPGQALTCGDIFYNEAWRNLWTSDATKCTNSNGTGNCLVENRSEVLSEDSTPHPAFGGGGMSFAVGELMLDTMWASWTTSYSTSVISTSPYVIDWGSQYSDFNVCQTAC